MDWKENSAQIIAHVERDQTLHTDDNDIFIPPILDQYYCKNDNISLYIDTLGNYTCGERNTGGLNIGTGGKEKDRFTVQLSCINVGKKLQPLIIWKASEFPVDQQPQRNTVVYDSKHVKW